MFPKNAFQLIVISSNVAKNPERCVMLNRDQEHFWWINVNIHHRYKKWTGLVTKSFDLWFCCFSPHRKDQSINLQKQEVPKEEAPERLCLFLCLFDLRGHKFPHTRLKWDTVSEKFKAKSIKKNYPTTGSCERGILLLNVNDFQSF